MGSNDYLYLFLKKYPHVPERRWKDVSAEVVNATVECIQVPFPDPLGNPWEVPQEKTGHHDLVLAFMLICAACRVLFVTTDGPGSGL